jgi:hypothetical protein
MKLRCRWTSGVAAAAIAAIVPTVGMGQQGAAPAKPRAAGPQAPERVVVAEVREARCRDGTRSLSVKMPDAGDQPIEVRLVDSQGLVSTYLLVPQSRKPLAENQACMVVRGERSPVFPWY